MSLCPVDTRLPRRNWPINPDKVITHLDKEEIHCFKGLDSHNQFQAKRLRRFLAVSKAPIRPHLSSFTPQSIPDQSLTSFPLVTKWGKVSFAWVSPFGTWLYSPKPVRSYGFYVLSATRKKRPKTYQELSGTIT
jgi:hypothetical protein